MFPSHEIFDSGLWYLIPGYPSECDNKYGIQEENGGTAGALVSDS
jgi:hypothetical protein